MKRIFLFLAIFAIATTFVFGQSKDEQEIRQTLNTIADALVKNDIATVSNHYADSYTFTNERGETTNKTRRLEGIKNTRRESFSYGEMNIRVFGNTAVAIVNPTFTPIDTNGQKTTVQDRATLTLVKTDGRWQIVAIQTTNNLINQAGTQSETEKQIGEVLTNWGNALGRRDAATVEKIMPADFMLMSPDGKLYSSRAEYLEVVKNYPTEATITGKGEKTIVAGDTAVQSGTYSVTPKTGGANATSFSYTATFVRRDGRWMPIAFNSRAMQQK
jgi:uncharacterized protein (TIGR02246 family)